MTILELRLRKLNLQQIWLLLSDAWFRIEKDDYCNENYVNQQLFIIQAIEKEVQRRREQNNG